MTASNESTVTKQILETKNVTRPEMMEEPKEDEKAVISGISSSVDSHVVKKVLWCSDLETRPREIWIVATAALPWRTGTAVNPLLRALYLIRANHTVHLLVPWLPNLEQRNRLYGNTSFQSPSDQEAWIRNYCRTRCDAEKEEPNLHIAFWMGSYNHSFGSIFPTEDICALIPSYQADVAILEEPEHLNWFRCCNNNASEDDVSLLGWAFKFNHVVGILHTNYDAYMKQYGVAGTSFVTARALHALSSLVVTAYCHKVIRLSAALPSLVTETREVVSNVHGVRQEFFSTDNIDPLNTEHPTTDAPADEAPVYFIGKVIWAKGFDHMLKLQELYHAATGKYFSVDVYGSGEDLVAIERAFYGRRGLGNINHGALRSQSIREQVVTVENNNASEQNASTINSDQPQQQPPPQQKQHYSFLPTFPPAVDVLGHLTGKVVQSGAETAEASLRLVESVLHHGIDTVRSFGKDSDKHAEKGASKTQPVPPITPLENFLPAKARFKWRKDKIPARFCGVVDHVELRDRRTPKIFLNMSTTEVLCTTSAEALAMGKFVILPKHASNEFFFTFPNCLAYESLEECLEQLQFALLNDPIPLSSELREKLSWEGATKRLYQAAALDDDRVVEDKKEDDSFNASDDASRRRQAVRTHLDLVRKSQFVSNLLLFRSNQHKKSPSLTSTSLPNSIAVE